MIGSKKNFRKLYVFAIGMAKMSALLQLVSAPFNYEELWSDGHFMGRRASLVHKKGGKSGSYS